MAASLNLGGDQVNLKTWLMCSLLLLYRVEGVGVIYSMQLGFSMKVNTKIEGVGVM